MARRRPCAPSPTPRANFTLTPAPAGSFFVHLDGRISPLSTYPGGAYYPAVGKKWHAFADKADNLAGDLDDSSTGGTGTIYLPLIRDDTLQTVRLEETPMRG